MLSLRFLLLFASLLIFNYHNCFGGITIAQQAGDVPLSAESSDSSWVAYINTGYVTYLSEASSDMQYQLASTFPDWSFTFATDGLAGTMTINDYEPFLNSSGQGGAKIDADYSPSNGDPALGNLTFIQMVDTNVPLGGTTTPYIDPRPNDDTLPFYWTASEMTTYTDATAGTINFNDASSRPKPANPDYAP